MWKELRKCIYTVGSSIISPISDALFKGDIRIDKQRDLWKYAMITPLGGRHFRIKNFLKASTKNNTPSSAANPIDRTALAKVSFYFNHVCLSSHTDLRI